MNGGLHGPPYGGWAWPLMNVLLRFIICPTCSAAGFQFWPLTTYFGWILCPTLWFRVFKAPIFTHADRNDKHTSSAETSQVFIAGAREEAMRLFGRFPAQPRLTNCRDALSQLHFEAANCFICCDFDLKHTFICITCHVAITATLNSNTYETKLRESITVVVWKHHVNISPKTQHESEVHKLQRQTDPVNMKTNPAIKDQASPSWRGVSGTIRWQITLWL